MDFTLHVRHPERWWVAGAAELPWLTDPDEDDGNQRWPDRDERHWLAVATVVEMVGRALVTGEYEVDPDDSNVAIVTVGAAVADLAPEDRHIIKTWFRTDSGSPRVDPWDDGLEDGRHRLWNAWKAAPRAMLPIYSALLGWLDDVPYMDADFRQTIASSATDGLRQLAPECATRSPRYVDELRRAAR